MKASQSPYNKIDWLPTGFSGLDKILGGGIPSRKITEISGVFSVGKSTLALQIVSRAQKEGKKVCWCDSEFSFGVEYAEALGVDCDKLELIQGRYAEENLTQIEEWLDKNKNGLVVLDSVGALLPREEAEKDAESRVIGGQAKIIARFCRKIIPILAINNNALVMLNHQFIDLMSGKLKTSGGAKLEYSKSIWLMLRAAGKNVMKGEDQVGLIIEAEIRKNKMAPTMKQKCDLTMIFGQGFSQEADLMDEAIEKGVLEKKGQFFFFEGQKVARGVNGLREALKDEALVARIQVALGQP